MCRLRVICWQRKSMKDTSCDLNTARLVKIHEEAGSPRLGQSLSFTCAALGTISAIGTVIDHAGLEYTLPPPHKWPETGIEHSRKSESIRY